MSVTIDSLQLEIQSNSTNATSGIDGLAKALKKLKKNSDISDAVTNLNNLRKSLHAFVNMPSNASKIESLANSMKSLKKVGKIDLGNSLASVKRAMESLGAINVENVAPQIERIAGALAPLNNVKGGGFNSTVNGLKKLDDVVDSLDGGSIDRFVAKIKELDEKLTPVSKKLVAIGHAFKGVNTSAISAGKGVGTFRTSINATALNLTNFISVAQSAIAALQPLIRILHTSIGDALEWDGIEYQFGNAFGEQADEYYQKITQITDALKINKQTFMEISAMSTSMLKGFGVSSSDARTMGLGYAELTYDIWAAYNNKYKTLKDASDAISSAIAGEVEPIRRAGFTIVESQLEITAANHGVAYSSEKATEAQKSYLRYLTLVDQAHVKGIVGAYADEMDTAEGTVRTFTQQLKTLSQTFGSVFLPILVKVVPWLTAFVELLGDAIRAIASVFGVEIQKFDPEDFNGLGNMAGDAENATSGIKDTTKALKDLKNATLGIDELNVISPPTQSGGSGGTGSGGAGWDSLDVESLWDKKIWENVQIQVDEIKEKIKSLLPVIGGVATAFAGWKLAKLLTEVDDVVKKLGKLEPTVKNLAKGLAIAGISIAVGKLTWDFTGAYLENGNLSDLAKMLGTTVIGTAVAAWLMGAKGAGIVLTTSGVVKLARLAVDLKNGTVDISDPQAIITAIGGSIETIIGGAITWKVLGPKISAAVKGLFGSASLKSIGTTIGGALSSGWTAITGALAAVPVWGWIAAAVVALIGGAIGLATVDYDFTDIGHKIGEKIGSALRSVVDFGKKIGGWLKDVFTDAVKWVSETLDVDSFTEFLFVWLNPVAMIARITPKLIEIGKEIFPGIIEGIKEGWQNLIENINEFVDGIIKGFKDGFEIHSPSKKMIAIGKEILAGLLQPLSVDALRDKIKEMWNSAKKWWSGKAGLEKIDILVNLKKNGWKTVAAWIGKIPGVSQLVSLAKSGWSSVKNWIGSIPTVSQGVKLAKSGWSSVKGWIGTIPVLSAPIKLIKSGWSSVKSWLGSLDFKLNFKLPKIGVNWGTRTVLGFKISYPSGFYTYAKGGFPDIGEMFIAREAGPEMVGRIGSKTTVANNDQIVEAVSEGVYTAVLAAMRASENNGSQAVNVYLDGRQITNAVEKRQHERGAALMGKEVFAY
jgi:hypothetical protein